ncbi:MAG TPA: thiamine diphosphokinase [Nitriliruptoraceae bacterium]|nr:thiamine diphosphokinase [Nitriliruptoraceae bacterium]
MATAAVITCGGDVSTILALARHARHITALQDSHDVIVIAADQGWSLAQRLDLDVDVLVGDLDSVSDDVLRIAEGLGVDIRRHPADKDATDLDLALQLAHERGAVHVLVCDGGGDRGDHALANLLTTAGWAGRMTATLTTTTTTVTMVTRGREIHGEVGSPVSLLPVFGPVRQITTTGLSWPLSDELLSPGSSRGVSNELIAPTAHISVGSGTLLVVQPAP